MSEGGAKIYRASAQDFKKIPGSPTAYWVSNQFTIPFKTGFLLSTLGQTTKGLITGDNNRFMRLWWEIIHNGINFNATSEADALNSNYKWYPCNKGGGVRLWYGNNEFVINWKDNGYEILKCAKDEKRHAQDYYSDLKFTPSISWSSIGTTIPSFRYKNNDLVDHAGMAYFPNDRNNLYYELGFLNSVVAKEYLSLLSPTINFNAGEVGRLPILYKKDESINNLVQQCIKISKTDWDSFETSWDFTQHPFLTHKGATVEESFENWQCFTEAQFAQLKANEEELNRIFIEIYGLQDELTPEVKDEDITIRKADLQRDVKSFISYAVGCMFGRYSIDKPGLILANAGETAADYLAKVPNARFEIDDDNIIPVLDDDYFHDDIVARFREFLKTVYGKETLEENMSFIAHALSPSSKAAPDKVLRDYFLKDFYADHLKIYQKRPIYWMFTSGKQQGFNALIYLHRYNKDTLGKIWGDYLRELEAKLDAEISLLENADKKNTAQLAKLKKQRLELKEYDAELDIAASKKIELDLDDGVAVNYAKFGKLVRALK